MLAVTGLYRCEVVPQDKDDDGDKLEEEAKPAEIVLDRQDVSMKVGESFQLAYQIIPDTAVVTDLKWDSSDPAVAIISENGLITALSIGQTLIKLSSAAEGSQDIVSVNVIPTILEHIFLEADVIPAYINQPKTLTLTFEPEDATDKTVKWETSDNGIVAIDQAGAITAKKLGYAWISADQGTQAYDHAVIVPAAEGQSIAASQVNVSTGEQRHFIYVYVAALDKEVTVNEVKLYLGSKGDPNSTELKTVTPALALNPGDGSEVAIEVNSEEANELTFGRYIRIDASIGGQAFYVYVSWFNNIEVTPKE